MSASDTGDEAPLVQFFSSVRNIERASAPASRTAAVSSAASRASVSLESSLLAMPASASAKRQSLDPQRRRVDTVFEFQIVGRHHRLEDIEQVTRDGHLAHRIGDLAVFDPEAGRATAVIAGHAVDAGAD